MAIASASVVNWPPSVWLMAQPTIAREDTSHCRCRRMAGLVVDASDTNIGTLVDFNDLMKMAG